MCMLLDLVGKTGEYMLQVKSSTSGIFQDDLN